jgi:pyruvate kinase
MNIHLHCKTKIIATLGPASDSEDILKEMFDAGTDVIRLNASHQSNPKVIKAQVNRIRAVSQKLNRHVGIFLDLQGPKIRVGKFKDGKVSLKKDQLFILTTEPILGDESQVSVTYKGLVNDVEVGQPLFIDDGKISLVITEKRSDKIICRVERDGVVSNSKGINLPATKISMSALTEKDREDVKLAVDNDLDYVALSFVSTSDDVIELREYLNQLGGAEIKIIAKIERQIAIDNITPIIEAADVVMVARGDLGVEIGIANVPKSQKMIIRECNKRIKPVIVATQMLESMIQAETATRAEVSDVANAIYDHCDAVMLSGETATGIDPVNVIKTMNSICLATDNHLMDIKRDHIKPKHNFIQHTVATSFCKAADQVAQENGAKAIIAFTSSGNTPLIASKLNPSIPIIAPTDSPKICQRMSLYRGVTPMLLAKKYTDIHRWNDMITLAIRHAKQEKYVEQGDYVVLTAGLPIGQSHGINSIRIATVS